MKYNKAVISAMVLLTLFSGSCLVAAYNISQNSKNSMANPMANQEVKDGLKQRLEDLQKQSLLEFNEVQQTAFNDEFFFPARSYFDNFEKELDRVFEENRREMYELNSKAVRASTFMIENTDEQFKVSALTQNVTKEMLDVTVHKGFLTVSAQEKPTETEKEVKEETKKQKYYSSFRKTIKLPRNVVAEKAQISFKDNQLVITFPKTELKEEKPMKLEVK